MVCIWLLMLWEETLCQSVCLSLVMGHLLTSIRLREDYIVTAGFHTVYNLSVPNTYITYVYNPGPNLLQIHYKRMYRLSVQQ